MFGFNFDSTDRVENKIDKEMKKKGYKFFTNFEKEDLYIYTTTANQLSIDCCINTNAYDNYGGKTDSYYAMYVNRDQGSMSKFWDLFDKEKYEVRKTKEIKKEEIPLNTTVVVDILPTYYTYLIKINNEPIITQSEIKKAESYKVIFSNNVTIVILQDGSKGIAKLNPLDKFDINKGSDIALKRALIKSLEKQIKEISK